MIRLLLLASVLMLSACTKTALVPEPVTYVPPAILMQPPHKNNIIVKPTKTVVEGPKEENK